MNPGQEPGAESAGRHRLPGEPRPARAKRRPMMIVYGLTVVALIGGVAAVSFRNPSADASATAPTTTTAPSRPGTSTASGAVSATSGSGTAGAGDLATSSTGSTMAGATVASTDASCRGAAVLTVAAAPEIAGAVTALLNGVHVDGSSCRLQVQSVRPATIAAGMAAGRDRPAAWIPDSSVWLARTPAAAPSSVAGAPVSLASSPVVWAVSAATAQQLPAGARLTDVLDTRRTSTPIRVGIPDPEQSVATTCGLLEARAEVSDRPDARAAFTWALRSGPEGLPTGTDLVTAAGNTPGLAVPVAAQALGRSGPVPVTALQGSSCTLDYPWAVTTADPSALALLAAAQQRLTSPAARTRFTAEHFGAPISSTAAAVPTVAELDTVVRDVRLSNEPSHLLAVIDVSGSMAQQVPGAGGATRLDLARAAAVRGLGLYGADSSIGLWEFSRQLSGNDDFRELAPVAPLGTRSGGSTGAQRIGAALQQLQVVPDGGTGLYDTTLAAVRMMRANWDPHRVNTVLLLTDGRNDDLGSISADQLVAALRAEADPARPVAVVGIAFGPDSDVDALSRISAATGGATYLSVDPRQIGEIFLDSVGQRLCRPQC